MHDAMRRLVPALAALIAGALPLAGCGGGSHTTATSPKGAGTGSAVAHMTKSEALVLARAINLQPTDVAGFKATPPSGHETAKEKALGRELERCAHGAGEAHKLAEAKSDEFKREAGGLPQEVSSSVSVEQSPAYAEQDLKAIRSPLGQRCIVKLVNAALASKNLAGAKAGAASISEGTPPAGGTNGAFGLRLNVPITVQGVTVHAYFDFLGFIHGPEEVTLQSIGVNQPFPAATQEHLFGVLVQHAGAHAVQ
jgi:hypothetical protein